MMQLDVYLDAGHRALGKWKRDSCRLNSELVSLWIGRDLRMTQVVASHSGPPYCYRPSIKL